MSNIWVDSYGKRIEELERLLKVLSYKGSYAEIPLTEIGSLMLGTLEEAKKLQIRVDELTAELNVKTKELEDALVLKHKEG